MKKKLHLCNSIKVTAVLLPVLLTGCSNAKEYTTDVAKTGNIAEEIDVHKRASDCPVLPQGPRSSAQEYC